MSIKDSLIYRLPVFIYLHGILCCGVPIGSVLFLIDKPYRRFHEKKERKKIIVFRLKKVISRTISYKLYPAEPAYIILENSEDPDQLASSEAS